MELLLNFLLITQSLFLFYDPTHLFKNIQNNWIAEKQYLRKLHETLIVLVNV